MKRNNIYMAAVAIAVALAFVMPGSAAFANVGTIGVTSNSGNTGDIENIVEISTNSDTSDNIENTIVTEETINTAIPTTGNTIYVDDDADPSWYNATQVKTITEGITNASAGYAVYVYNGTYYECVTINKQLDLIGESRDGVIIDGGGIDHVVYSNVNNTNITKFTLRNSWIYKAGIYFYKSSNNNIINCNTSDNNGHGIHLYGCSKTSITNIVSYNNRYSIYLERSSNCSITNGASYNNSEYGIYVRESPDCNITICDSYNNSEYGIYIAYSPNCNVTNIASYNNSKYGIYITYSSNCSITNCASYNNTEYGIYLKFSSSCNIMNCAIYNNIKQGIYIDKSPNGKLRGNTIYDNDYNFDVEGGSINDFYYDIDGSNIINGKPIYYLVEQSNITLDETDNIGFLGLISCTNITAKNSNMYGILMVNTSYSTISNISSHNSKKDIYLYESSNCSITNCDSYGNDYSFYLKYSSNNNIINCNIYNNSKYGIYHADSSNNNIINCNVYNNPGHGIYLRYSLNCNIANCNVYNNIKRGIYFRASLNCSIMYCNSYNNQYGIYLYYSSNNNLVHHNNLINSSIENGYDECSNTWDDGSEGNYWDNYTGVDDDGDGIGDTPYNISGGDNQDRYPLMEPIKDSISPVTTHEFYGTLGDNDWFVSDVTITLNATDDLSGVEETRYRIDFGLWQVYADPVIIIADDVHTLEYYSIDFAGNEEDVKGPFDFKIDQTIPEINLTVEKTGLMKWLLTATVSDETSGVAKVEFYLDGELLGNVTESPYEWEVSEKGTAHAIVYDNAGNDAISDPVPVSYSQSQSQSSSNLVPVQRRISWICHGGLTGIQNTQRRV